MFYYKDIAASGYGFAPTLEEVKKANEGKIICSYGADYYQGHSCCKNTNIICFIKFYETDAWWPYCQSHTKNHKDFPRKEAKFFNITK